MATTKKAKTTTDKAAENAVSKAVAALMGGKKLTDANQKVLRVVGASFIDGFMKAVGAEDPSRLTDKNGWRHFQLESAKGIAGIIGSEGELYLHVEALVMALQSDKDRGTQLLACATENMRSLSSAQAYGELINMVMVLANTIDVGLNQKHSGTTRTRKGAAAA